MSNHRKLIVAMAGICEDLIQNKLRTESSHGDLPEAIRPAHLLCMCDTIKANASTWPETKLHRWLGFIQCGVIANHIVDLDGAKSMFDEAKKLHPPEGIDSDLVDHLDPESVFNLELGGQG